MPHEVKQFPLFGSSRITKAVLPAANPVVWEVPATLPDKKKRRVAAYCRVSTFLETQEGSLESQRLYYEHLIASNPAWQLAGIFAEAGHSAANMDSRPVLQKLLSDCQSGNVDLILTKSISRFARNFSECLKTVRMLADLGVDLWFEKEAIRTDTMGSEFLLSVLACLAEEELHNISANIKWGIQARFQAGTYVQALAPYGYQKQNGSLVMIPEEAAVIRMIFEFVLAGNGVSSIAEELNRRGFSSPRGKKWGKTSLLRIIRNPVYAGDLVYQKTFVDGHYHQHWNRGEYAQYSFLSHHEAIITREVHTLAVSNVCQRGKEHGVFSASAHPQNATRRKNSSVFSGRVYCALCGSVMYRISVGQYPVYKCSAKYTHRSSCNATSEMEDTIKNAFITCLNKLKWSLCLSPKYRIPDVYLQQLRDADRRKKEQRSLEIDRHIEKIRIVQSSFVSSGVFPPRQKNYSLWSEKHVISRQKKRLWKGSPVNTNLPWTFGPC